MIQLIDIVRYPIKGFAGEPLESVEVRRHCTLPGDRAVGLQHQDRVPPHADIWRPKQFLLQSVQTDRLAEIDVQWMADHVVFQWQDRVLTVPRPLEALTPLADWVASFVEETTGLVPVFYEGGLTDEPKAYVSLINQASVDAIAKHTETQPNAARYRGNLTIAGAPAFVENDWVGKTLSIGSARFSVVEPIVRCKATQCDWQGSRDLDFLDRLEQTLHTDLCGLFLEVIEGGTIRRNDAVLLD